MYTVATDIPSKEAIQACVALGQACTVNALLQTLNIDGREIELPKIKGGYKVLNLRHMQGLRKYGWQSGVVMGEILALNQTVEELNLESNELLDVGIILQVAGRLIALARPEIIV